MNEPHSDQLLDRHLNRMSGRFVVIAHDDHQGVLRDPKLVDLAKYFTDPAINNGITGQY